MKRLLKVGIVLWLMLVAASTFAQTSNNYRALTIGAEYGNSLSGRDFIIGTANLYYEIGNKWAITSWNGYQVKSSLFNNRWSTSEVMIRKELPSGLSFSSGLRHNMRIQSNVVGLTFAVVKVGYKIKL